MNDFTADIFGLSNEIVIVDPSIVSYARDVLDEFYKFLNSQGIYYQVTYDHYKSNYLSIKLLGASIGDLKKALQPVPDKFLPINTEMEKSAKLRLRSQMKFLVMKGEDHDIFFKAYWIEKEGVFLRDE